MNNSTSSPRSLPATPTRLPQPPQRVAAPTRVLQSTRTPLQLCLRFTR
jgi:hypothetical protein